MVPVLRSSQPCGETGLPRNYAWMPGHRGRALLRIVPIQGFSSCPVYAGYGTRAGPRATMAPTGRIPECFWAEVLSQDE